MYGIHFKYTQSADMTTSGVGEREREGGKEGERCD
jgi:hypothetical protein